MSSSPDASPSVDVPDSVLAKEEPPFADMIPSTISPKELHAVLRETFTLENQVRLRFIAALRAFHENHAYKDLGYSSTEAYTQDYYQFGSTQLYEYLKVAKALDTLSRLAEAFQLGQICYSVLRDLIRIAEPGAEERWLEFVKGKTSRQVHAEVTDALEKGRKLPRDDSYGLPNVKLQLVMKLAPEKHAIVTQALERVSEAVAPRMGGQAPSPEDALVFLAQTLLQHGLPGEDAPIQKSGHTVVYERCVNCGRSRVMTSEGFMEVDDEVVAAIEGNAEKIDISEETPSPEPSSPPRETESAPPAEERPATDPPAKDRPSTDRPNTAGLVRRVLLREGRRCANPCCLSEDHLHCHHIVWRCEGGRTEVWNEIALCAPCHALVHVGALRIRGNPLVGIEFIPASRKLDPGIEAKWAELARIPRVETVQVSAAVEAEAQAATSARAEVTPVDGAEAHPRVVRALESIGYPRKEARERVSRAYASRTWGPEPINEEVLFNLALRA